MKTKAQARANLIEHGLDPITAAAVIPTTPDELYRTMLFRIVEKPLHRDPKARWHVANERGHSVTTHRTRLEAADEYVQGYAKLTGNWPDESETQEDGRIVYSMEDGSALVVMFDGTIRHYQVMEEPHGPECCYTDYDGRAACSRSDQELRDQYDRLDHPGNTLLSPAKRVEYEQASLRG